MANRSNNSAWILVVILAVSLQVVFVFADCKQTATGTAIDFSKAYFLLNADMEKYMCSERAGDEDESAAATYLQAMTDEIHLKGLRRTCIHPVFAYVAKLFRLGQTHEFEETLELVKKDGKWKVCGTPYGLSLDV
ncbi:MAG: hypothetical protein HGJ94_08930 [Desulfosarcina sp.]|nr:hypothetical protein [Desulfosarcina sp.]